MSWNNVKQLFTAAKDGTLEDVQAAFKTCDADERKIHGSTALYDAAKNSTPHALDMVKFLIERGVKPDTGALRIAVGNTGPHALDMVKLLMDEHGIKPGSDTLSYAAGNEGPCALEMAKFLMERGAKPGPDTLYYAAKNTGPCALEMVKLMIERGANPHEKNWFGCTAFTKSLYCGNIAISDYLFSRDDFALSNLMPRQNEMSAVAYKEYREKAISRVSEAIDAKGLPYAKAVAADIEKILKSEDLKPTKEDTKALGIIAKKIAAKDWVVDAQVSSDDFLGLDVTR